MQITGSTRLTLMIGTPFAVIGLVLAGIAAYLFARDGEMKSWPHADGVITRSTIEATLTQARDKQGYLHSYESCVPTVRYTYTADGKKLEGSKISREPFATARGEAEQWIGRYPVGKVVEVHYDPKDPASSVLEFKTSVGGVILGGLGGLFLLLGIGIVVVPLFIKPQTQA